MKKQILILAILAPLTLISCGKMNVVNPLESASGAEPDIPPVVHPYATCDRKDIPTINLCAEAVGEDYNDQAYIDIVQASCEDTGGTFSTNNCDRPSSIGTCYISVGETNETHVTYYAPEYDENSARVACQNTPGGFYRDN